MQLFEVKDGNLSYNPEILTIKEFKEIWNRDKSKNKKKALSELSYIYFYADYKSVYKAYDEDERVGNIITDVVEDKNWKPDEVVQAAIVKYKSLSSNLSIRMLEAAESAGEKVIKYFKEIDLTKLDKGGKPIYSAKDLMVNMKQVGDVLKGIKTLKEEVAKEEINSSSIRGGGQIGFFEDSADA